MEQIIQNVTCQNCVLIPNVKHAVHETEIQREMRLLKVLTKVATKTTKARKLLHEAS